MLYKRILVAVDGSKTSLRAFDEALKLAKASHAKLCILHIIERLPDHVAFAIDVNKYQLLANKNAKKLLDKFKKMATKNKVPVETKLIEIINYKESIAKKIIQSTKSWKANLLVIGTHGFTGFSRLMLGSVAEVILKSATTPVLIVRSE